MPGAGEVGPSHRGSQIFLPGPGRGAAGTRGLPAAAGCRQASPPSTALPRTAEPCLVRGLSCLISLTHRTRHRGLPCRQQHWPGMVKPLLKTSCGLHSLSNPASSRNVPASVKSGPSSFVWSRQSPAEATCSALGRTARSAGGSIWKQALSRPGSAVLPHALHSSSAGEKRSPGSTGRSRTESDHGPASCSQGSMCLLLFPAAPALGQVATSRWGHFSNQPASLPPPRLPSIPSQPHANLGLTFSGLKSSVASLSSPRPPVRTVNGLGLVFVPLPRGSL